MLKSDLFAAFRTTVIFLVLCGLVFPLVLVGIGQIADRPAAEGSVLTQNGTVVGSSLIGQSFVDPMHFQSRPSGVSNWGPNNPALIENVSQQVAYQKQLNPSINLVPIDLVTQSGSGVDPNIASRQCLAASSAHFELDRHLSRCAHAARESIHRESRCRRLWRATGQRTTTQFCTG